MKAILEFDLPEDANRYKITSDAMSMSIAIWDFKQYLRNELKHNPNKRSDEYLKVLDDVQEKFYEFLGEFEYE